MRPVVLRARAMPVMTRAQAADAAARQQHETLGGLIAQLRQLQVAARPPWRIGPASRCRLASERDLGAQEARGEAPNKCEGGQTGGDGKEDPAPAMPCLAPPQSRKTTAGEDPEGPCAT